jgi:small GTP-binding protein
MLGNADVGKSTLASRYITGTIVSEYGPTVGGVFYKKDHSIGNGHKLTLNLWDTAGE